MTATERLRELLDECDEYYKTSGNKTWWGRPIDRQTGKPINVFHYQAQPMGEDRLFVELQLATPEQAIAATLDESSRLPHFWTHDGVLHIELPKMPESISVRLPDQRDREVGSAGVWQYTRDSGTCHAIVSDNLTESEGMGDAWADCSECGHLLFVLTDPNSEPPNYCPNCGAKVVDE